VLGLLLPGSSFKDIEEKVRWIEECEFKKQIGGSVTVPCIELVGMKLRGFAQRLFV
jgi:hypothetical protein